MKWTMENSVIPLHVFFEGIKTLWKLYPLFSWLKGAFKWKLIFINSFWLYSFFLLSLHLKESNGFGFGTFMLRAQSITADFQVCLLDFAPYHKLNSIQIIVSVAIYILCFKSSKSTCNIMFGHGAYPNKSF